MITDASIEDVRLDGNVQSLTVNGIDVTAYVEAELDRRHPDRRHLQATDLDGLRQAWKEPSIALARPSSGPAGYRQPSSMSG